MPADTAERRRTIETWQSIGRAAARVWFETTGEARPAKYRKRKASHVAYIDGWNSEVRLIRAGQRAQLDAERIFDG